MMHSGATSVASFRTPHGRPILFIVRDGTSDWNTCNAITAVGDEYHMPEGLTGWALDVGGHIGACATTLLIDNPELRVVVIEPLPENVELIRQNLKLNDVDKRCLVYPGAASGDQEPVRIGYGEVTDPTGIHEFIGNENAPEDSRAILAPGITLGQVLAEIRSLNINTGGPTSEAEIAWTKIDCEGGEHTFFDSPMNDRLVHIEGEVHPYDGQGGAHLRSLLESTHEVTFPKWDENPDFGPFTAVRR